MFKISEFSKLSRIPLQTLRYYDQIGLLKPAKTDESSGYRYYSAEQLLKINRIVIFKELGFTLQQISAISCSLTIKKLDTQRVTKTMKTEESVPIKDSPITLCVCVKSPYSGMRQSITLFTPPRLPQ